MVSQTSLSSNVSQPAGCPVKDGPEAQGPAERSPEETNRAIVYAVIDQLGLKLQSTKDAVEMLVVAG